MQSYQAQTGRPVRRPAAMRQAMGDQLATDQQHVSTATTAGPVVPEVKLSKRWSKQSIGTSTVYNPWLTAALEELGGCLVGFTTPPTVHFKISPHHSGPQTTSNCYYGAMLG